MDKPVKKKRAPGAGRPKEEIKTDDFELMCSLQCTKAEMADAIGCSTSKIEKWCRKQYGDNYSNVYKRYSGEGKISLRRSMFRNAVEKDNATIQIWLSKQHLGMRDQHEVQVSVKPFIVESPDGKEIIKLGVDHVPEIEGVTIDVDSIDRSEQNYYDAETIDEDNNEPAKTE